MFGCFVSRHKLQTESGHLPDFDAHTWWAGWSSESDAFTPTGTFTEYPVASGYGACRTWRWVHCGFCLQPSTRPPRLLWILTLTYSREFYRGAGRKGFEKVSALGKSPGKMSRKQIWNNNNKILKINMWRTMLICWQAATNRSLYC